ncbi:MAG TPA: hypothetical protein VKV28_16740 [Candidatus Binataceae bacterium]|nr:hypothetical protein [Candidatus Binataceae bacterium]
MKNPHLAILLPVGLLFIGVACATGAAAQGPSLKSDPPSQAAKADPPPDVTNCAIVTVSTPMLYACKGKVYTAYQLQQLREAAQAAHKQ